MAGTFGRLKRFYVPPHTMEESEFTLRGPEVRHMIHVLRLKPGHSIEIFDGLGGKAEAEIVWWKQDTVGIKILEETKKSPPPKKRIVLAPALIRWNKMKVVLQKAVELGTSAIWPFVCSRSVARSEEGDRGEFIDRAGRVLIEAMKQCRANWLPDLAPPVGLNELFDRTEPGLLKLFLYENEASTLFKQVAKTAEPHGKVLLMVGPEGGFTAAEAEGALAHGFYLVSLGKRILRAETAAIVALGITQYEWGGMDN